MVILPSPPSRPHPHPRQLHRPSHNNSYNRWRQLTCQRRSLILSAVWMACSCQSTATSMLSRHSSVYLDRSPEIVSLSLLSVNGMCSCVYLNFKLKHTSISSHILVMVLVIWMFYSLGHKINCQINNISIINDHIIIACKHCSDICKHHSDICKQVVLLSMQPLSLNLWEE